MCRRILRDGGASVGFFNVSRPDPFGSILLARSSHPATLPRRIYRIYEAPGATLTTETLQHIAENRPWFSAAYEEAAKAKSQSYQQKVRVICADTKTSPEIEWSLLLSLDQSRPLRILLMDAKMNEREDSVKLLARFPLAQDSCDRLSDQGGLRRYEGRSWQGLHKHIALCFMAEHLRIAISP